METDDSYFEDLDYNYWISIVCLRLFTEYRAMKCKRKAGRV